MSDILSDLSNAFSGAVNADPLYVLAPLAVVALAEGLQSDGPFEAFSRAFRGLFWLAVAVFLFGGFMSADRFELAAWGTRLQGAWDDLLGLKVFTALGFYLLLLAGVLIVSVVRSLVKR